MHRRPSPRRNGTAGLILGAVILAALILPAAPAWAQREGGFSIADDVPTTTIDPDTESPAARTVPSFTRPTSREGFGAQLRASHYAAEAVGRDASLTPFEFFPYYLMDTGMIFGDMRMFVTNRGEIGGNGGLGYRQFLGGINRVVGASVWYDGDNSTTELFSQVGLSLETYGNVWDARANFYLPVGEDTHQLAFGVVPGSTRFTGTQILFDQSRSVVGAMRGVDTEAGLLIPGEIAEQFDLRVYGGWYHFEADDIPNVNGWKGRVQAAVIEPLDVQIEVTSDQVFDTNVVLGATWTFGKMERDRRGSAFWRIGERVRRNYNIVVKQETTVDTDVIAFNQATNANFRVRHVAGTGTGGAAGTAEDPLATIADAQAAGADIIFVRSGTVLTGADAEIVLNPNVQLLGEGDGLNHIIQVPDIGALLLPQAGIGANAPILQSATGDAITLASGSRVSGFVINDAGGRSIVADAISNFTVDQVTINDSTLAAVSLTNVTGGALFSDLDINGGAGVGVDMNGGTGSFDFQSVTIDGTTGDAVQLASLQADANVIFNDLTITNRTARGIFIDDSDGEVTFTGTTTISNDANSVASAIDIRNSAGAQRFLNAQVTDVTGAAGVNLQDNTGLVRFQNMNVTGDGATGLLSRNGGNLQIDAGVIDIDNGTAVDLEDTNMSVSLTTISSNNAAVGLRLVDTTGTFAVFGGGDFGTGGLIEDTTTGVFLSNAGNVGLAFVDFVDNGTGLQAQNTTHVELASIRVTNSTSYAIDSLNNGTLILNNSLLQLNGTGGVNSIRSLYTQLGSYAVFMSQNTISSAMADSVFIENQGAAGNSSLTLTMANNDILNTGSGQDNVQLNWDGTITSVFQDNTFRGQGLGNNGLNIAATDTTAQTQFLVNGNIFGLSGNNSTGVRLVAAGPSTSTFRNNLIGFTGTGGTGLNLSLAGSNTVNLLTNQINDSADGMTGILFSSLAGPSAINIDGNSLNYVNAGNLGERGFVFQNVSGTVNLSGSVNNTVIGTNTVLVNPFGTLSGRFIINNAFVP